MSVKPRLRLLLAVVVLAGCGPTASAGIQQADKPAPSEKDARTPAQQKINSQVLYEIYRRRGVAREKGVPEGPTGVRLDDRYRALVDIRADVTPALLKTLRARDSAIVSTAPEYRSIIAWIPLLEIERIAAAAAVRAIEPAPEGTIRKLPVQAKVHR